MDAAYCYLALIAGVWIVWRLRRAVVRSRDRKARDFQRRLETVLLPRERVRAVCQQKKGRYILTGKRLLRETPEGFAALDLRDIKSACGVNAAGNRTTVPGKMVSFAIKADSPWELANTGEDFEALVKDLMAQLKRRRKKKQ